MSVEYAVFFYTNSRFLYTFYGLSVFALAPNGPAIWRAER